eukprot:365709-Chlamydomonas_euryale.AAC.8
MQVRVRLASQTYHSRTIGRSPSSTLNRVDPKGAIRTCVDVGRLRRVDPGPNCMNQAATGPRSLHSPLLMENNASALCYSRVVRVVRRGRGYARQYLTQWEGYGEEHTSWEPEDDVKACIAYQEFWDNRPRPTSLKDAYKLQAAK